MNNDSLRNRLRLHAGMIACAAIVGALAAAALCALLGAWWLALAALGASLVILTVTYSAIRYLVKLHQGIHALSRGQHVEAEARMREALSSAERFAAHDPRRGEVLQWLALVTKMLGDYDAAEASGTQALACQEAAWGDAHPRTLLAVRQLAEIYLDIARYAEAEHLLQRSVAEHQKANDHYGEALDCNALARIRCELRDYAGAESLGQQALTLLNAAGMQNAVERLGMTLRLAHVSARLGKLDRAESWVQAALECEQTRQPDST